MLQTRKQLYTLSDILKEKIINVNILFFFSSGGYVSSSKFKNLIFYTSSNEKEKKVKPLNTKSVTINNNFMFLKPFLNNDVYNID